MGARVFRVEGQKLGPHQSLRVKFHGGVFASRLDDRSSRLSQGKQLELTTNMGKPKRAVLAAAQESVTPPDELTETQFVARVRKAEGNSLYTCELPNGRPVLVELEPKFRNTIFIRRGGYVLVDLASEAERSKTSKVAGEIINIVREEKEWRKQPYWHVLCACPMLSRLL